MAKGVNKVFLLGNVGKDPEIRTTAGGMTVASCSLATADRAKDAQGNWADKTEWHNLVCFQRTAEVVRDYVKKGSQIFVEGKIQTRSWDANAKALGEAMQAEGYRIVSGGTDTHLILVDVFAKGMFGSEAEGALGAARITVNHN